MLKLCVLLQAQVYRYDDEEWQNVVARDADWDRAETDYLLSLSEQYDLRFLVIADRYEVSFACWLAPCSRSSQAQGQCSGNTQ